MHPYRIAGAVCDMAYGRDVILILARPGEVRPSLEEAVKTADALGLEVQVRWANGAEAISMLPEGKGRLRFRTTGRSQRGFSADAVIFDERPTEQQLEEALPMVNATGGTVSYL